MFFLGQNDSTDAYVVQDIFFEKHIEGFLRHVHDSCRRFRELLDKLFFLVLIQGRGFKRDDRHTFYPEGEK